MEMTDRFDLPVTSASAAAIGDYVAAVDLLLSANTGAAELLERALAADPDFALAHVARARLLQLQARMPEARAAVARAKELRSGVSAREQQHIDTISRAVEGCATEALALVYTHASEYPRDALPLSLALGVFGLLGFSGRLDHHEAQLALLEELAPHWGEDWWFLGYLGWAYIETGEVAAGTRLVERSLAGNPRNAHAAHQRVHGFFEAGDPSGGADFIRAWLSDYDRAGHLHCHLSWHLALFELARGDAARARAVYLDSIRPSVAQSAPMLSLADSASFLWRWRLYGAAPPLDQQWGEVAAHARRHFPQASLAFADLHAALAEAAIGNDEFVQARIGTAPPRPGRPPPTGQCCARIVRRRRCPRPWCKRRGRAAARRGARRPAPDWRKSRATRGLRGLADPRLFAIWAAGQGRTPAALTAVPPAIGARRGLDRAMPMKGSPPR